MDSFLYLQEVSGNYPMQKVSNHCHPINKTSFVNPYDLKHDILPYCLTKKLYTIISCSVPSLTFPWDQRHGSCLALGAQRPKIFNRSKKIPGNCPFGLKNVPLIWCAPNASYGPAHFYYEFWRKTTHF